MNDEENKLNKLKDKCQKYWFSRPFDGYTSNDEYGTGCFGPSDETCPICEGIQGLMD